MVDDGDASLSGGDSGGGFSLEVTLEKSLIRLGLECEQVGWGWGWGGRQIKGKGGRGRREERKGGRDGWRELVVEQDWRRWRMDGRTCSEGGGAWAAATAA